jgi:hypothetical protein
MSSLVKMHLSEYYTTELEGFIFQYLDYIKYFILERYTVQYTEVLAITYILQSQMFTWVQWHISGMA